MFGSSVGFKSDRCGIETVFSMIVLLVFRMFKSDRCGIETRKYQEMRSMNILFKSDRCGIETIEVSAELIEQSGSNQTVAGLKRIIPDDAMKNAAVFKSDRCGIETIYYHYDHANENKFKSDRCGIETFTIQVCNPKPVGSNQTVAGLKPSMVRISFASSMSVQIRPLRD